jgi:hypothetical protein
LFLLGLIGGKSSSKSKELTVYDASEVLSDYADNERAAEKKYGRKVRVRGKVTGFLGNTVLLEHGPAISCFDLSDRDVEKLHRGSTCVIEGKPGLGNEGGVWLHECRVVE